MWSLVVVVAGWLVSETGSTVEHQVTAQQAYDALLNLNLSTLEGQGCKPCTDRHKGYCLSNDLLMDHCICDHRHVERLPYVEHTCHVPTRPHPTFAEDCLDYVRVLECCCHSSLLPLMHAKLESSSSACLPYYTLLPVVFIALGLT